MWACIYGICSVKNIIENETNLTDCTCNLTQPNVTETHTILSKPITVCTTVNTTESRSSITNTFQTLWRSEINENIKIEDNALNRRWRRFYLRRTVYHIY
jgi:hypothetical protein